MVATPGAYQASCNGGELRPELHGRTDIKQFYSGLAYARNIEPVPQGGARLAPRTRHIGKIDVADISAVRLLPFTFSTTQAYVAVLTAGRANFWRAGALRGGTDIGVAAGQIAALNVVQRLDTLLLFHPDIAPIRILRTADDTWPDDLVPFVNVPLVDYGGSYSKVTDVWKLYLRFSSSGSYAGGKNLYLVVSVNGEDTPGIETGGSPDWNAVAAAIAAAIAALASVDTGVTVSAAYEGGGGNGEVTSSTGFAIFTITFGGDNNGEAFAVTAQVTNTGEAAMTASHVTIGDPGGEALFSETRGWPACASFYQDRLVTGGFKAKRGGVCASVTGEYFDLNTKIESAAGAILVNIDTDGAEELHRLQRARHLVLFTTDAEYFISDRALDRTTPPNIVNCSRNGSAQGVPIVESEGDLIYVSANRALLYAMRYDDVAQAYVSTPLSLLASHIASDVTGMALQRASTATDANRLWLVRDDGTMTQAVMIRGQDVTAFVRWETDGIVRDVCVDGQNDVYLAVERVVDGAPELHLEKLEQGLMFDGAVTQLFGSPTAVVANLGMHEGAQVWAEANGYVVGPFTVTAGAITLPSAATLVTVGRWTPPLARTLPLPSEVAEHVVLRRPKRVHTVRLDLLDTKSIAVGANGRPAKDLPLYFGGWPVDVPPPPFTGPRVASGLIGFSDAGQVEITQVRPGALAWRAITIEARQ